MALIVEDGTGLSNAQSLVSVADADTILALRLHTDAWDALTALGAPGVVTKEKALAWYSRILTRLKWKGSPVKADQALCFPRIWLERREPLLIGATHSEDINYFPSNAVPDFAKEAVAVGALMMLAADVTALPETKGIKSVTVDVLSVVFDAADRDSGKNEIPDEVAAIIGFALDRGQLGRGAKPAVRV